MKILDWLFLWFLSPALTELVAMQKHDPEWFEMSKSMKPYKALDLYIERHNLGRNPGDFSRHIRQLVT